MQIFTICRPFYANGWLKKTIIIMKLTTLLMILGCLHLNAAVFSQTINLSEKNVSLEKVFSKIEQQTGYTFFYRMELISAMPNINISLKNVTVDEALDQFLSKLSLTYSIIDKTVVIKPIQIHYDLRQNAPTIYIGKVLDENDKPMPGVSVRVKGTNMVFVTNQDGQFITGIIQDPKAILQISYIGYENQEVAVSTLKNPILFKMKLASSDLDQVQVTAYGTTTKRINPGNIVTINAEELAKSPGRNVLEIIQGRVPGMFVQQMSGLPGSPFNMMIRGQQTFSGGNFPSQPLIVIDGVVLPGGALPKFYSSGGSQIQNQNLRGGNPLDYIDPSIIESINILKDADATSIYGSRGAYGVILIVTKKGKAGEPKLSVNANSGLTVRGSSPELLNTEEYIMLRKEAKVNDNVAIAAADNDINGNWPADRYTDWSKLFGGRRAVVNKVNANYSGGNDYLNFLIGANYRNQASTQIGDGAIKDGGIHFNLNNMTKNEKLAITLSGNYSSTKDDAIPYDFANNSVNLLAPNAPPLFLPDGSLNWADNSFNAADGTKILYNNVTNDLSSTLGFKYRPVKGLSLNASVGYKLLSAKELRAQPTAFYNPATAFRTTSTLNIYSVRSIVVEPNISYTTKLAPKGTLNVQTGGTYQDQFTYYNRTTGNDFLSDAMLYNPSFADPLTAAGAVNVTTAYDQVPNKYIGFFGIISYNWDNKYILNLNGRYDGSTKFGEDHQFGSFGSAGASWVFSRESWFKGLLPVVSFAKLRASYGTSGGDGVAAYSYIATYDKGGNQYQGSLALTPTAIANKDLHWEYNRKAEGGLLLEFLKGRITLDASYYNSITKDQLVNQLLPSTTGYQARPINSPAVIKNWGYELEVSSKNIAAGKFTWSSRFNITLPENRLVAYPGIEKTITNNSYVLGKPIQGIKVYNYAGVDPETGIYNFINRDGVKGSYRQLTDPATLDVNLDRTVFIDLTPKYYGGLGNTFSYKSLSMDVFFTFTNRMGRNFLGSQTTGPGFASSNPSKVALRRWQSPGQVTDVAKATANLGGLFMYSNFLNSSGAYSRATYARLSNLNISYGIPQTLLRKVHINALSIYLQGSNLLTISKYGDLDPENLGAGTAPLRTFTAGLNLTL